LESSYRIAIAARLASVLEYGINIMASVAVLIAGTIWHSWPTWGVGAAMITMTIVAENVAAWKVEKE
jgi:hypothetical protein